MSTVWGRTTICVTESRQTCSALQSFSTLFEKCFMQSSANCRWIVFWNQEHKKVFIFSINTFSIMWRMKSTLLSLHTSFSCLRNAGIFFIICAKLLIVIWEDYIKVSKFKQQVDDLKTLSALYLPIRLFLAGWYLLHHLWDLSVKRQKRVEDDE